jgi:pimeloyl-ACP methyl ester carboxylesterase
MAEETLRGNVETLNGVDIYFEIRGTGEPLLLLHGFSGSSQDYSESQETLGAGFQLIVPDLRGHGRSSVLVEPFRHRDAAEDMLALLDHAGIQSYKAIGISGGGNVLLHLATKQPERVKAMVLVSATPYFPAQARAIMRIRFRNHSGNSCDFAIREGTVRSAVFWRARARLPTAMTI